MSISEETLRMLIEVKGEGALLDLQARLESVNEDIRQNTELFAKNGIEEKEAVRVTEQLAAEKRGLQRQYEALAAYMATASGGIADLDEKTKGLTSSTVNASVAAQSMLHIFRELATGRIYGLAGNVERLSGALGLTTGGLATVMGAVALAGFEVYREWDKISGLFGRIVDGSNDIPVAADRVEALGEALRKGAERLRELAKEQALTNTQLREYNQLAEQQVVLERKKEDEQKKAAARKAFEAIHHPEAKEVESRRAEQLTGSFGDPKDRAALVNAIYQGLDKPDLDRLEGQYRKANDAYRKQLESDPLNLVGLNEKLQREADRAGDAVAAYSKQVRKEAEDIAAGAVTKGDTGSFGRLQRVMKQSPDAFTPGMRQVIGLGEEDALFGDERFQAEQEEAARKGKERRKRAADQKEAGESIQKGMDDVNREIEQKDEDKNAKGYDDWVRSRSAAAQAPLDAAKTARESDRAVDQWQRRVGRENKVRPEEQVEAAFGQQIQAQTGASAEASLAVAKRSLDLQQHGWDATNATQQAMAEVTAAMNGMVAQYQMLTRRAEMITNHVRQLNRNMARAAESEPQQNMGWGP